jgi:hypothetical protein
MRDWGRDLLQFLTLMTQVSCCSEFRCSHRRRTPVPPSVRFRQDQAVAVKIGARRPVTGTNAGHRTGSVSLLLLANTEAWRLNSASRSTGSNSLTRSSILQLVLHQSPAVVASCTSGCVAAGEHQINRRRSCCRPCNRRSC